MMEEVNKKLEKDKGFLDKATNIHNNFSSVSASLLNTDRDVMNCLKDT